MTPKELLIKTREVLQDPTKWGKGPEIYINDLKLCLMQQLRLFGAELSCFATAHKALNELASKRLDALNVYVPGPNKLVAYNDHETTTHNDVLSLLDEAIHSNDQTSST